MEEEGKGEWGGRGRIWGDTYMSFSSYSKVSFCFPLFIIYIGEGRGRERGRARGRERGIN